MQSLTGSEDLTLIEFLMSLSSAADIKEYVAQYLGPKVYLHFMHCYRVLFTPLQGKSFGEEFARRREFGIRSHAPSAAAASSIVKASDAKRLNKK
jgi:hypothetical protein